MKALVYLGPGRMEPQEVPDAAPGEGEVLIRSHASAICGSDLHGFREATPRRIPPLVMGHETVGVVEAVGSGVDPARLGERVVLKPILSCGACLRCREGRTNLCAAGRLVGKDVPGGFAELLAVPSTAAVRVAADVADDVATLMEPVANAMHVVGRSVRPRNDVVVIGAGPIGVSMARVAAIAGAGRVYCVDLLEPRLRLARAQGAIAVAAAEAEDVLSAAGRSGADVVIDAAGYQATWDLALRCVRPGGRIEAVGLGEATPTVDAFAIAGKEATITGSFAWTDDEFERAAALVASGEISTDGWFTHVPLADGQRAFEELVGGGPPFKVVLLP